MHSFAKPVIREVAVTNQPLAQADSSIEKIYLLNLSAHGYQMVLEGLSEKSNELEQELEETLNSSVFKEMRSILTVNLSIECSKLPARIVEFLRGS